MTGPDSTPAGISARTSSPVPGSTHGVTPGAAVGIEPVGIRPVGIEAVGVEAVGVEAVERPVTVAVTGAHSTGKTSFLARLASRLRLEGVQVATVADLGEQALQSGLPILYSHVYASTLWIMTRGISQEVGSWPHTDVLLVDRPVPDALAYYLVADLGLAHRELRADRHEAVLADTIEFVIRKLADSGADLDDDTS